MPEFREGRASDRKLRLFAYACARRILNAVPIPCAAYVLDALQRRLDGNAGEVFTPLLERVIAETETCLAERGMSPPARRALGAYHDAVDAMVDSPAHYW